MTLRRWGHGFEADATICIDGENYAAVYRVVTATETTVDEGDYDQPIKVTRLQYEQVAINGDYAVLPGDDTTDVTDCLMWMRCTAVQKICVMD